MSTHLPIRSIRPLCRQNRCLAPASRPFSSSIARPRQQRANAAMMRAQAQNNTSKSKAPQTQQNDMASKQNMMMEDLGLFSSTFVRGEAPSLVGGSQTLKVRGRYEWTWLKQRFQDILGRLYYFWRLTNWPLKQRPRFNKKVARNAAVVSYEKMYKAFARNDTAALKKFCLQSLVNHLTSRIQARPQGMKVSWELLKADKRPVIVSHRATKIPIPGEPDNRALPTGMRQVVFRVKTKQRFTVIREDPLAASRVQTGKQANLKWKPEGSTVQERRDEPLVSVHEKDVVEYVVMQQRMLRGKLGEWKLWGFAQPTTVEKIAKDKKFEEDTTKYQAANPGLA